ncbi:hypothetical protein [Pseudonocardia xishanensis]|uniref:Roadblock/LAMTOR2 domain-containing protein n=1 Tax=Pseudonocardia xishanensis TaxID=630995 RepID=A0ABP8S063_9PSEU
MTARKSLADALGKLPGVSWACVLERADERILESLGGPEPPLPVAEILAALVGVESLADGRSGALRSVVVTGRRTVQMLAPATDERALYVRLDRGRANLASALREVEALGDPPRRAMPAETPPGPRAAAVPVALPAPRAAAPASSRRSGSTVTEVAPAPAAGRSAPAGSAAPTGASTGASTVSAAGSTPASTPPSPVVSATPATAPATPTVAPGTPAAGAAEPPPTREDRSTREGSPRRVTPVSEFFAAAHRARPPLPDRPTPFPPAGPAGSTLPAPRPAAEPEGGRTEARGTRPSGGAARPAARLRVPADPTPAPAETVPPVGAAADPATAPAGDPVTDPAVTDPAAADPAAAGAAGRGADSSVTPPVPPADGVLPRRSGRTAIPPPRPPAQDADDTRWATDMSTLRRLADGLRRRLR